MTKKRNYVYVTVLCGEPGSSVSSVWLRAGRPRDRGSIPGRGERIFPSACVQTGSGAHPASCIMGTGVISPGLKRGRGVTLTSHPI
jgi:hypothetical protein